MDCTQSADLLLDLCGINSFQRFDLAVAEWAPLAVEHVGLDAFLACLMPAWHEFGVDL